MELTLAIAFVAIVLFIYNHFTKYNNHWKVRNVPGPEPSFFFGNMKDLFLRRRAAGEIFKEIYGKYPEEKYLGIFTMRTPALLIKDADIIKDILIKDFDSFMERGVDYDDLGTNLFHANGDIWRVLRNRLSPIFSSAKLKNMVHLMNKPADTLVNHIEQLIKVQNEQDAQELVKKFTQANLVSCAFGVDINSFEIQEETLKVLEEKTFCSSYSNELEMMYPGILKRIGGSLYPNKVKDYFYNLTKYLIAEKYKQPSDRKNVVDLLVALKKEKQISGPKKADETFGITLDVTDAVLAAQVLIIYIGGYQTSSATIASMLYHLAANPDIQDKVVTEIESVLTKHKGNLTLETVSDLKYMDQVFKETLRMNPAIDTVKRLARVDYKIPGTHVTVKKGQIVIFPLNVIHRDAKYYPKPDVFDPDRFSTEHEDERRQVPFIPFGEGPRQCIGKHIHYI